MKIKTDPSSSQAKQSQGHIQCRKDPSGTEKLGRAQLLPAPSSALGRPEQAPGKGEHRLGMPEEEMAQNQMKEEIRSGQVL